jgi:hypothetical protein
MPLGIYLARPQGRIPATLPTHFTLNDFRKMIQKKIGNPDHYDYSLGDVIFRTWNEEVFNRQRSAIRDGVNIIIEYARVGPDSAPWRQVSPGLCLEGVCVQIQCQAFEHKVVINQGVGTSRVITDSLVISSSCPMCSAPVQPSFCAFYQCSWRASGLRHEGTETTAPSTQTSTEWQTVTDDYYRWPDSLSSWSQLTVETKK